ncbi:MAG: extracellular solute-binding protein [Bifidobacteriaceae bacterium]|nr:extracellular solute-binding protein [Bifidobacteriaceae bacterium]
MQYIRKCLALLLVSICLCFVGGCQPQDTRTVVHVWSWDPIMKILAQDFEAQNPDIRIDIDDDGGYDNLNSAIQNGYNLPDVVQLEYYALPQYVASDQVLDITKSTAGYSNFYTSQTWASVVKDDAVYGVPMDAGPVGFYYNQSVFEQVNIDASKIRTWNDFYYAAKKLRSIGVYIAADAGDPNFFNAMIWLNGGQPYTVSSKYSRISLKYTTDLRTREFIKFWQRMIDEDLIDTSTNTWDDQWVTKASSGQIATAFSGGWAPSLFMSKMLGNAGLWRVGYAPTIDGKRRSTQIGGSALSILKSTRKPEASFRFIEFVCHSEKGISKRVSAGGFPADLQTLNSSAFMNATTLTNDMGQSVAYFGGQQFNRILVDSAQSLTRKFQYLPIDMYARLDFSKTVGKAYSYSKALLAQNNAERLIENKGLNYQKTSVPSLSVDRVTLFDGVKNWQDDIRDYGYNQGFYVNIQ